MNKYYRHRKSPRLQGYDYAQNGAYFVTICTHNRELIFGQITDGDMELSELGEIALTCWKAIPSHFSSVELDVSIVMPNHVHGIIVLPGGGATLGTIIGNYKAAVTRASGGTRYTASLPTKIWQARYHDHIIRNEAALQRIQAYIVNNPAR